MRIFTSLGTIARMGCEMHMLILYGSYKEQEGIKFVSEPLGSLEIIQYSFYFVEKVTEQVKWKNLVVSPSPKILRHNK